MAYRKFLKPTSKVLIVRDPITKDILPETGDYKPMNKIWRRRINDGSVILLEKPKISFGSKIEEKMESPKYENKNLKFKKENKA